TAPETGRACGRARGAGSQAARSEAALAVISTLRRGPKSGGAKCKVTTAVVYAHSEGAALMAQSGRVKGGALAPTGARSRRGWAGGPGVAAPVRDRSVASISSNKSSP